MRTHPFFRRWEAGNLSEGELAAYAEQYRHIERAPPPPLGDVRATPSTATLLALVRTAASTDPALALALALVAA